MKLKANIAAVQVPGTLAMLLLPVILGVSCNKTLKLPDVSVERKIVLLGELTAGDSAYVRAGQSVPLTSSSSLRFELLNGFTIIMEDNTGTSISLNGYIDDHSSSLYTIPYSSVSKIQAGNTYNITASHTTLGIAKATVQIPGTFTAVTTGIENTIYSGDSAIKINIRISDPPDVQNYYVIEALKQLMDVKGFFKYNGNWLSITTNKYLYDQEKAKGAVEERFDTTYYKNYLRSLVFTEDANAENAIVKSSTEANRRLLLRDRAFNGQSYNTTLYVAKDYMDSLYQKGRLLLQVKSVSEKYFMYLKRYDEQIDQGGVNTLGQPVKVEGNITNGVGIIGGVYKNEFAIKYDDWIF